MQTFIFHFGTLSNKFINTHYKHCTLGCALVCVHMHTESSKYLHKTSCICVSGCTWERIGHSVFCLAAFVPMVYQSECLVPDWQTYSSIPSNRPLRLRGVAWCMKVQKNCSVQKERKTKGFVGGLKEDQKHRELLLSSLKDHHWTLILYSGKYSACTVYYSSVVDDSGLFWITLSLIFRVKVRRHKLGWTCSLKHDTCWFPFPLLFSIISFCHQIIMLQQGVWNTTKLVMWLVHKEHTQIYTFSDYK